MDLGILSALALLVAWALGTWLAEPPGWFHALLSLAVFGLIWRIVDRQAGPPPSDDARRDSGR
jgi:predicted MFS family arabinose efflux permease